MASQLLKKLILIRCVRSCTPQNFSVSVPLNSAFTDDKNDQRPRKGHKRDGQTKKRDWSVPKAILNNQRFDVLKRHGNPDSLVVNRRLFAQPTPQTKAFMCSMRHVENDNEKVTLLSEMETEQLKSVLADILNMSNPLQYVSIVKTLESECCSRISSFDIKTLLYIADAFHEMEYQYQKYLKSLLSVVAMNWNRYDISHTDVSQLLFYIGSYRNAPIELMSQIEDYLIENAAKFNGLELGLVCHAFFSANTAFRSYTVLNKIANVVLRDMKIMKPYLLANILKTFKHAGYENIEFYDKLGTIINKMKLLRNQNASVLIHILLAYSNNHVVHKDLYGHVSETVNTILNDKSNKNAPRSKDLMKILNAFATVQQKPPENLVIHVVAALEKDMDQGRLFQYPETFVECLASLAILGVYPEKLINFVFSPQFIGIKRKQPLEQKHQLLLLNTAVQVEQHDYKGNTISEAQVKHLRSDRKNDLCLDLVRRQGISRLILALRELLSPDSVTCGYILQHSHVPDIQITCDEAHRLVPLPGPQNDAVEDVLDNLKNTMTVSGSAGGLSVIEQLLREENKEHSNRRNPEGLHILPKQDKERKSPRKIAIKVMGWNQYTRNSPTLLGVHSLELRLLSGLGYQVLVVNPSDASKLDEMSSEERKSFIQTTILDKLNIVRQT